MLATASDNDRRVIFDLVLGPLQKWLADPEVMEICVNKPGEVWIERVGQRGMKCFEVPDLHAGDIEKIARRVAGHSKQHVNHESPLLSGALPGGHRLQAVIGSTAPNGGSLTIRRQVTQNLTLEDYEKAGKLSKIKVNSLGLTDVQRELVNLLEAGRYIDFLRLAVKSKQSMLFSGGTGTGKTTLLNALMQEIPEDERILSIEDTREVKPPLKNYVPLIASRGNQGQANVTMQQLLEAALRMRPDRIILGEIRGEEAWTYLRAVNTGHPGSLSTVHSYSPTGAYDMMALLVMQAGFQQLRREELIYLIKQAVPIVVQLERGVNGPGGISEIHCEFKE